MKLLGGTLIAHNVFEYDYTPLAALSSLLSVCDEVVFLDAGSTDDTAAWVNSFSNENLKIVSAPWNPCAMGTWLSDLTNEAKSHLNTKIHLSLQSDEVLHEDDFSMIKNHAERGGKYSFERLNFWLDNRHRLKDNVKVGSRIVRMAPIDVPSVGDAQSLEPSDYEVSPMRIFHYGFIRNPEAFVAKSRPMQQAFFNTNDPILDAVEKEGLRALGDKKHETAVPMEDLIPYKGSHPRSVWPWLRKNGYTP